MSTEYIFTFLIVLGLGSLSLLGSYGLQRLTSKSATAVNGKTAMSLRKGGMALAVAIGMTASVQSYQGYELAQFAAGISIDVAVLLIGILIASQVTEHVLLPRFNNIKAIYEDNNIAVGIVEFATYLSTGIIAAGAFTGMTGNVITAIAFFLVGQVILVVSARAYEWFTPYCDQTGIQKGELVPAIMLGGNLFATSLILHVAVSGDFTSWQYDITQTLIYGAVGIMFSMIVELSILLKRDRLKKMFQEKNIARAIKLTSVKISMALIISTAI